MTSLEELKDRTREITSSNRENAKRALARANAVASSGGNWVSPTSGDPLVMNAAPSRDPKKEARRSAAKAKEAKRKAKEAERRKNQPREPNPWTWSSSPSRAPPRAVPPTRATRNPRRRALPPRPRIPPPLFDADRAARRPPPLAAPPFGAIRRAERRGSRRGRGARESRGGAREGGGGQTRRRGGKGARRGGGGGDATKSGGGEGGGEGEGGGGQTRGAEAKNAAAKDAARGRRATQRRAPGPAATTDVGGTREGDTAPARVGVSRVKISARGRGASSTRRRARVETSRTPGWNARKNSSVASATSRDDAPLNSSLWTTKRRSARLRARSGFARWSARDASFEEIASRRFATSTPTRSDETRTRRTKRRKETKRERDANARRDDGRWSARSSNSSER